ncbi:Uncharacterised protein [Mycobacteroides abscessus subsp. abscessus]|nr:Uncharacterised protein [Mycobacteroides abscessus subsp. abscessus]
MDMGTKRPASARIGPRSHPMVILRLLFAALSAGAIGWWLASNATTSAIPGGLS